MVYKFVSKTDFKLEFRIKSKTLVKAVENRKLWSSISWRIMADRIPWGVLCTVSVWKEIDFHARNTFLHSSWNLARILVVSRSLPSIELRFCWGWRQFFHGQFSRIFKWYQNVQPPKESLFNLKTKRGHISLPLQFYIWPSRKL